VYAHLEWFIKQWWTYFLEYIKKQNKIFIELNDNFFDEHIKRLLKSSKKINNIFSLMNQPAIIYYKKKEIQTKSNINWDVLKWLVNQFWFDLNDFNNCFFSIFEEYNKENLLKYILFFEWIVVNSFEDINIIKVDGKLDLKKIDFDETYKNILGNNLLKYRNWIAHWEKIILDKFFLEEIKDLIIIFLDTFKELFNGYLVKNKYLKNKNSI
jgi:hypothetical protein